MKASENVVYVIDDDLAVRKALSKSLIILGYSVQSYESAEIFLESFVPARPSCLVLDVRMPGMSGMELQKELIARQIPMRIIFISGHGDIPMSVNAIKLGAIDFLEKPYQVEQLLTLVAEALELDSIALSKDRKYELIRASYDRLTAREIEVMELLVAGAANTSNKIIAKKLEISHRTVDDHRTSIMAKMQAKSITDLVIMSNICGDYGNLL
ncbi:MAG: response regulator [Granulosicoccaceae bacterium]